MSDEVKEAYSPGLAGVIAGESAICWVHPDAGLLYRGYDIHELAKQSSFEEVTWLLLHGELPTMEQLGGFERDLAAERSLPHAVLEMLRLLPARAHPMDVLRTGVSMLAAFDSDLNDTSRDADLRKAVRLIAKVSTLIADGWRITHGEEPWPSDPTFKHAGNFLLTLNDNAPAARARPGPKEKGGARAGTWDGCPLAGAWPGLQSASQKPPSGSGQARLCATG